MTQDTKPTTEERRHCTLGGSSADIWANCPGSYFYTKDLPKDEGTKYTDLGTRKHNILDIILRAKLAHYIEGTHSFTKEEEKLLQKEKEHLPEIDDVVERIWTKGLESTITGKFFGTEDLFMLSEEFDIGGFADFWCVYIDDRAKRVGLIVDYKSGFTLVEAKDNPQLALYACAMQEEFTKVGKPLDYIRVAIDQPQKGEGLEYEEHVFTKAKLESWKKKFLKAANQIFVEQKPKFKVGDHCTWCKAQAICVTYNKDIVKSSSLAIVDTEVELPTPELLDDDSLRRILLNSKRLKSFLNACDKHAIQRYIAGSPIAGTKVVQSAGKRKWLEGEDENIGEKLIELGVEQPYVFKLKGITETKNALKPFLKGKKAEDFINSYTTKSPGKPSLVSIDDPRPAVATTEDLIGEITEDDL